MAKLLIAFFLVLLMAPNAFATYPMYRSHFYSGSIVLRGNPDTIRGQVLLDPSWYEDMIPNKKIFEHHKGDIVVYCASKYRFFPKNQVLFARLYYEDKLYTDFSSFVYHQDTLLLRLLSSGRTEVYDSFLSPLKNIFQLYPYLRNQTIFISKDSQLEELPARFSFNYKNHILKFLNKRYHTDFNLRDFKSNQQMFDYI